MDIFSDFYNCFVCFVDGPFFSDFCDCFVCIVDGQKPRSPEEIRGPDFTDERDEPGVGGPEGPAVNHPQR